MADLDRVMKGLECCTSAKHPISCDKCDYFGNDEYNDFWSCRISLMRDALTLLKAQEARVMMVEEAQQAEEGTVVWFEQHTPERDYVSPMVSTGDGCIGNLYLGINLQYVKDGAREYRFWSGKPTDAQREAVKWNE